MTSNTPNLLFLYELLIKSCILYLGNETVGEGSKVSSLQEVQSLICSYLHDAFIAEPNLAKLVHFQVNKYL